MVIGKCGVSAQVQSGWRGITLEEAQDALAKGGLSLVDAFDIQLSMRELSVRYGHDREGLQRAEQQQRSIGTATNMAAALQAARDAQACSQAVTHCLGCA